ncbi:putative pectinesterase/pectinesterase inhibitor 12 [Castanea sativa]|uniref:putative pectinesterase/pectinesterase inhibitor 12 n=1 Tax=Castanea sativa TaxID=21020 RepID=UPI003F654399
MDKRFLNVQVSISNDKTIIYVKQGVYEENVEIPSNKPNIFLRGEGTDATKITGNRSVGDGWTTFRSATLVVSGDGFLVWDITIEKTAGAKKHQAVALRVNADFAALYRCYINGYQRTLWIQWSNGDDNDDQELDTLYYGEYENNGPGSSTNDRVTWKGYHRMNKKDAYNFRVSEFINNDEWLDSTSFPYPDGVQ